MSAIANKPTKPRSSVTTTSTLPSIETLQKFCAPDREGLGSVFNVGKYTVASDGKIWLFVPRMDAVKEGAKSPAGVRWVLDMFKQARRWRAIGPLPPLGAIRDGVEFVTVLEKRVNGVYIRKIVAEFGDIEVALTGAEGQCPLAFRQVKGGPVRGLLMGLRTGSEGAK